MTHDYLVKKAASWLRRRCGVVLTEEVCVNVSGEIPDAIGFTDGGTVSFLIECKTSISDFKKDMDKPFRKNGFLGMGDFRFYMAPEGLIKINDLPEMWGLIEVSGRKSNVVYNPFGKGNIYSHWVRRKKNGQCELNLLYSKILKLNNNNL